MSQKTKLAYLEEELEVLVNYRKFLMKKIDRLRKEITYEREKPEPPEKMKLSLMGNLYVPTNCITPHVLEYVKRPYTTVTALAEDAGVSHKTIMNILDAETEWTHDKIAEAVFMALDLPHIYSNLTPVRLTRYLKAVGAPEPPPSQYFEE